jgi:cobalamin biosynthesis protein CobD/CbiB
MNNNKQQTAVDIAFEKLANQGLLVTRDYKNLVVYREAKEMEKEQINEAFVECWKENMPEGYECKQSAEQYYNETYKTKKP